MSDRVPHVIVWLQAKLNAWLKCIIAVLETTTPADCIDQDFSNVLNGDPPSQRKKA